VNITSASNQFPTGITNPQNKTTTGWFGQVNFKLNQQLEFILEEKILLEKEEPKKK